MFSIIYILYGQVILTLCLLENNFQKQCSYKYFECDDKKCIPYFWTCDGKNDCDVSIVKDLNLCIRKDCAFTCKSGNCLDVNVCNREKACLDSENRMLGNCWVQRYEEKDLICFSITKNCFQQNSKRIKQHIGYKDKKRCKDGCSPGAFSCPNGDCFDGIVEINCTVAVESGIEKSACKEYCTLKSFKRCNEISCSDSNYQIGCPFLEKVSSYCKKDEFVCKDKLGCVSGDNMCDGKDHCYDASDENEKYCKAHEIRENDQDEIKKDCDTYAICSQYCTIKLDKPFCFCARGFKITPNNPNGCEVEDQINFTFTRRTEINEIDLSSGKVTTLLKGTKISFGLDFHFEKNLVIWSELGRGAIFKASENNITNSTVIVDSVYCYCLAVNWINNTVYWGDFRNSTIEVINLDSSHRKLIAKEEVKSPRALAVDPIETFIFWSDCITSKIERADLDGGNRKVIVGKGIECPNEIALDLIQTRLFWVDAWMNCISSIDYDGNKRRNILFDHSNIKHPYSLLVFGDWLYWSDWDKNAIMRADKFFGKEVQSVFSLSDFSNPNTIRIFNRIQQPLKLEKVTVAGEHVQDNVDFLNNSLKNESDFEYKEAFNKTANKTATSTRYNELVHLVSGVILIMECIIFGVAISVCNIIWIYKKIKNRRKKYEKKLQERIEADILEKESLNF